MRAVAIFEERCMEKWMAAQVRSGKWSSSRGAARVAGATRASLSTAKLGMTVAESHCGAAAVVPLPPSVHGLQVRTVLASRRTYGRAAHPRRPQGLGARNVGPKCMSPALCARRVSRARCGRPRHATLPDATRTEALPLHQSHVFVYSPCLTQSTYPSTNPERPLVVTAASSRSSLATSISLARRPTSETD